MKRLFALLILIGIGMWFFRAQYGSPTPADQSKRSADQRQTTPRTAPSYARSIFVPYWQLDAPFNSPQEYDRIIYFGVAGTIDGISRSDPGYQALPAFIQGSTRSRWLTIRMTDSEMNDRVLDSLASQQAIVNDAVALAKAYEFEGVVLDFEYRSLFGGKIDTVTAFYRLFGESMRKNDIIPSITMYGDVLYRARPYDLRAIQSSVDEVMIMAYDLHKSRGEPGPNFPLSAGKSYGYGYDRLLKDILPIIPADKLTFIFGMYGYDWKVDDQKRPITVGESKTTAQITKNILTHCTVERCTTVKDRLSGETEINYVDGEGRYHIVWFENEDSVAKKTLYLESNNIHSIAYWAYGYF